MPRQPRRAAVAVGLLILLSACTSKAGNHPASVTDGQPTAQSGSSSQAAGTGSGSGSGTGSGSASLGNVVPTLSRPARSISDVQALAKSGDASRIHPFARQTQATPGCPTPNVYATVDSDVIGQALAADALAYFSRAGLLASPCAAALYLFHAKSERTDTATFTAGRVFLDENASGPKHKIEVDLGPFGVDPVFSVSF